MKKTGRRTIRKKPSQQRSQVVFDSIIEASQILLNTEGLAGFTTNKVAKKAGVSIGSLYQYFPNKETILEKIMIEIVTRFFDDTISFGNLIKVKTPEELVEMHLRHSWEGCLANTLMMRSLFQISKSDELVRHIFLSRWKMAEHLANDVTSRFKNTAAVEELKAYLFVLTHSYMGIIEALCYTMTDTKLKTEAKNLNQEKVLHAFLEMAKHGLPAATKTSTKPTGKRPSLRSK